MDAAKIKTELPQKGMLHDYFYSAAEGRWKEWATCLPKEEIPASANYGDIIVPNVSTAQFDYLVQLLVSAERKVLVCDRRASASDASRQLQRPPRPRPAPRRCAATAGRLHLANA